jgi:TrmH family RNA methyltransferase
LGRRSARREEGAFVIEGPGLVREAVAGGVVLEAVYVGAGLAKQAGASVLDELPADVPVHELAPGVLERVASTVTPQAVLAVARRCDVPLGPLGDGWAVVAAGVADPGNLGTILRVAEAAGASRAVALEGTVDAFSPKVVRASAGAVFQLPISVDVAPSELSQLDARLWATAAHGGVPYTEADLALPLALVLGSEAHGVPASVPVDATLTIPHQGRAESLNVAMAAAVLGFEIAHRAKRTRRSDGSR